MNPLQKVHVRVPPNARLFPRAILVLPTMMLASAAAAVAAAPCTSMGGPAEARTVTAATQDGANLIIAMSILPKLMKIDRQSTITGGTHCERGSFQAGSDDYRLMGEDADGGAVRRALPGKETAPAGLLIPISSIDQIVAASKAKTVPPVVGYLLATITDRALTGWRFYSAIPTDPVLIADMQAALTGTLPPIFRDNRDTGKTEIFVGHGSTAPVPH